MLNSKVNFDFSIMKKLWDLAHEKLIIIIGRHGILDQCSWMSAIWYILYPKIAIYIVKQLKNDSSCEFGLCRFFPFSKNAQVKSSNNCFVVTGWLKIKWLNSSDKIIQISLKVKGEILQVGTFFHTQFPFWEFLLINKIEGTPILKLAICLKNSSKNLSKNFFKQFVNLSKNLSRKFR